MTEEHQRVIMVLSNIITSANDMINKISKGHRDTSDLYISITLQDIKDMVSTIDKIYPYKSILNEQKS